MANRDFILAGIGPTSMAWFAPKGTAVPTTAAMALNVAFVDPGWVSEDGLRKGVDENTVDINAYGSQVPVRTFTTRSKLTFGLTFLESNANVLAIYNRLPLTGTGSLTVGEGGLVDFTEGESRVAEYAAVFDATDGVNKLRIVVPVLQVTERAEFNIKAGEAITYGITCTAYPAGDGVAAHYYYSIPALDA